MYNGIPGEPDQPSSTNENAICDFLDHPYSSPSEDSENDDVIRELDFSEFSMDNTTSLRLSGQIAPEQNQHISVCEKCQTIGCISERGHYKQLNSLVFMWTLFTVQNAVTTGRKFKIYGV